MNRVQLTYTRSWSGLPTCESTPIHSLSFNVEGAVVGLMNVGGPQESASLESKVPLFTATVFGREVRSNPSPAQKTWPALSNARLASPPASENPPVHRPTPRTMVPATPRA